MKPDNIILKYEKTPLKKNVLKIVDFGLSSFIDVEEYLFKRCGTPGFVAPEVINADKNDPNLKFSSKCDVFSVGIIFYFMLTGKIPYDGESFHDVLANNKKADIDFSLPYLKKINPTALDLLKNMLELDVEKRYSATECLQHNYFDENCEYSEVRRDSINFNENIAMFKQKYTNANKSNFTDSIRFNANPDQNGNTDTFNAIDSPSNAQRMKRGRIDSFHSKATNPNTVGSGSPSKRNSIYKRALMGRSRKNSGSTRSRDTSIDSRDNKSEDDVSSPANLSRPSRFGQKK